MSLATFTILDMPREKPDADKRIIVTTRLLKSLTEAMNRYRQQYEYPPTLATVIERAVREFLDRQKKAK